MRRVIATTLAVVTLGAALSAAPAQANTGNPLDIGPVEWGGLNGPPPDYPQALKNFFARPSAGKWGYAEQVLPATLADGQGSNSVPARTVANCISGPTETPIDSLVSYSPPFIDSACRLHPGKVLLNVGTTHRPKNKDNKTHDPMERVLFARYSQTPDCLIPTGPANFPGKSAFDGRYLDVIENFDEGLTMLTFNVPEDKVGQYLCLTQGYTIIQEVTRFLSMDWYAYQLRGPWTSYRVVGTSASDRPAGVTATAGDRQATIAWTYPEEALRGTKFTATSTPGGKTCTVTSAKTCTVTGLTNGTSYTFVVTAERNSSRFISDASAAVTPAGAAEAPAPPANAVPAEPLAASRVLITPVNSDQPQPLGTVDVIASLTGSLAANQQLTARSVLACFVQSRGDRCGDARQVVNLQPVVNQQRVRVWIPRAAAGAFLRVTQSATTSAGDLASPAVFRAIGRNVAAGPARVDPPAGADPNANVPQQAGEAAPVDGAAAPEAPAGDAAVPNPEAPNAAAPNAAPAGGAAIDAGSLEALAAAANVKANVAPIVNTEGEGSNGTQALKVSIPSIQGKNKKIPLAAVVAPRTLGVVTFTLARVTPKGQWVIGKVKTATVGKKGKAATKWILESKKPAGNYTVVASFVPKADGVPGVTVTKAITVK